MDSAFSRCHPAVNFLYFACMLGFTMFLLHPVCLAISLVCAGCYAAHLGARPHLWLLPVLLTTALINPLFSHAGLTVLAYFPSGNALTAEAIAFGLAAAAMMAAAIGWCAAMNRILTADKLTALFGRRAPTLGLLLSMALGFVPRLGARLRAIRQAQRALQPHLRPLQSAAQAVSILLTWSMESAITTADSMKSRGYGLARRTRYLPCRFDRRDAALTAIIAAAAGYLLCGAAQGALRWHFYPTIGGAGGLYTATLAAAYALLGALPGLLDWKEARAWKRLRSNI
ncbi:MAG: energy-coupling factor transporter transmembrane component T [Oscillospiraceae bacterium]|nr:energy-coupling factor transporter transmembrane component T [Oscillospiraceae bacterium]